MGKTASQIPLKVRNPCLNNFTVPKTMLRGRWEGINSCHPFDLPKPTHPSLLSLALSNSRELPAAESEASAASSQRAILRRRRGRATSSDSAVSRGGSPSPSSHRSSPQGWLQSASVCHRNLQTLSSAWQALGAPEARPPLFHTVYVSPMTSVKESIPILFKLTLFCLWYCRGSCRRDGQFDVSCLLRTQKDLPATWPKPS